MRISLITNYRENVIHEVFDKLQKNFNFFEINKEQYLQSKLRRFLKRIEFQIINSLESNIFVQNCNEWLKYLKSFTYPQIRLLSDEYLRVSERCSREDITSEIQKIQLNDVWISKNQSLLNLQVECNEQGKILFEPNYESIRDNLCHPLYLLNEMVNSFQRLEKTAVPLIDLDLADNYKVEQYKYINIIEQQIVEFIQIQWDTYVTPLVEKYSRFSHFFISESVQLQQIFDISKSANLNLNINLFYRDIQLYSQSKNIKSNKQTSAQPTHSAAATQNKSWISSQQQQQQQIQQIVNTIAGNNNNNNNNNAPHGQNYKRNGEKLDDKLDSQSGAYSGIFYSLQQLKDTESIRDILMKFHADIQTVKILACDEIKTPLFLINLQPCKKSSVLYGTNAKNSLLKSLVFVINQNINQLEDSFEKLKLKISKYPNNEEDLVQIKIIIDGCETEIESYYMEIIHIGKYIDLVEDFFYEIDPYSQEQYWMLYTYPQSVRDRLKQSKQIIESQEKKFKDAVDKEKQILLLKIEKISQDFQSIKNFNNYQLAKDYSMEAQSLNEHINDALYQCQQINRREQLLVLPLTKYVLLDQIKSQSIYFIQLWDLAFQLQIDRHKWMLGSLMKISFEQFKEKIQEYDKNKEDIKIKIQELVEDKSILKVISEIQKDIDQSREISWMIEYLTTEAMIKKPQFFRDLFKECNLPVIEPNEDMSLKALIDIDLVHFRDQIREASERADNVFNTEKQLLSIQDRLKETLLELGEFRESFIIVNMASLQLIIAEQATSLQDIKESDRSKLAPKKVQEIDQKFQSVSQNITQIASFQELYIKAVDIIDKIEYEKKTNTLMKPFHQSESFWRGVIRQIKENNCLFETDFLFDYTNQIIILQKFIQQFDSQ